MTAAQLRLARWLAGHPRSTGSVSVAYESRFIPAPGSNIEHRVVQVIVRAVVPDHDGPDAEQQRFARAHEFMMDYLEAAPDPSGLLSQAASYLVADIIRMAEEWLAARQPHLGGCTPTRSGG